MVNLLGGFKVYWDSEPKELIMGIEIALWIVKGA